MIHIKKKSLMVLHAILFHTAYILNSSVFIWICYTSVENEKQACTFFWTALYFSLDVRKPLFLQAIYQKI